MGVVEPFWEPDPQKTGYLSMEGFCEDTNQEPALLVIEVPSSLENAQEWFYYSRGEVWAVRRDEESAYGDDLPVVLVAAILDRQAGIERTVSRARARVQLDSAPSARGGRQGIPDDVKMFVWQRDGGACVRCGVRADLEFDHIIPLSLGGANTARNLQLLCGSCNRAKGGNIV